jgi:hypothetical protein
MRARYYDPTVGRFISEDPLGVAAGINPYTFADGDPVNFRDPSGLAPVPSDCPNFDKAGGGGTVDPCAPEDPTGGGNPDDVPTGCDPRYPQQTGCPTHQLTPVDVTASPNPAPGQSFMYTITLSGDWGMQIGSPTFGPDATMRLGYTTKDASKPEPVHGLWTYGNWCGTGGMGTPINAVDAACQQHDACYARHGYYAGDNYRPAGSALRGCNQALCTAASNYISSLGFYAFTGREDVMAARQIISYFSTLPNIANHGCKFFS